MLIKASYIITMAKPELIKDGWIEVEDGRIVYVGKERPKSNDDEVIDLTGRIVLPGFVNAHSHCPMTIYRGLKDDVDLKEWLEKYIWPAERLLKPEYVYWGAMQGIAEMVESGITAFADMYFFMEEVAKAVIEHGVRALLSWGVFDVGGKTEEAIKIQLDFLESLERFRRSVKGAESRVFFSFGPHAPYTCSRECLEKINELSKEKGYRIQFHLAETRWEFEKFRKEKGMTPVEYLGSFDFLSDRLIAAHVVWTTDKDLELLKLRGVHVAHNPSSNMKLASGFARVPEMLDKGINVALATDGPASNNRLDMLWEMRLAALIHKGYTLNPTVMNAKTVLKMATINGAKALSLDKIIGSIEVGKRADFVVLNPKNLLQGTPHHDVYSMIVYSFDVRAVEFVFVDGELIYESGEHKKVDIATVREKVQEIRDEILQRLSEA